MKNAQNAGSVRRNFFVLYFGLSVMAIMGILNGLVPDPNRVPNSVVLLNVWTINALIAYLVCWFVAAFQLFIRHKVESIVDLQMVSALYCLCFVIYAYNPLFVAGIFFVIFLFLFYISAPVSYFRRYYTIQER